MFIPPSHPLASALVTYVQRSSQLVSRNQKALQQALNIK